MTKTARKRFKVTAGKAAAAVVDAAAPGEQEHGDDPVSYFLYTRPPGPAEPIAQQMP